MGDLTWVRQTLTVDAIDPAVKAIESNPGWQLLGVGMGAYGQTTLTYGWPAPARIAENTDGPGSTPGRQHTTP